MRPSLLKRALGSLRCSRSGKVLLRFLIGLVVFVVLGVVVWQVIIRIDWTSKETRPTMYVVSRGEFLNELTERGDVKSTSNVEVRCEVKSRGRGEATILWVIPEGTNVKPGDKLIEFDASALESDLNQQQISYKNSKAEVTRARNDLRNARNALKEYNNGTYPLEEMTIRIKAFTAEEDKRQALQKLNYTKELARKGYVPDLRVEKDQFAFDKAELDYKSAQKELEILEKYKKPKMLKQLDTDIKTAKASLASAKARGRLVSKELDLIEKQIKKCVVDAKEPGEVVYANQTNRYSGREVIIEAGATVREKQVVLRLPDPKRMQIKAEISESKITAVKADQPVRITLDAMPDVTLRGVVDKVDEYPAPPVWWAGNIKNYQIYVRILDIGDVPLKTGLTAKIRIEIERTPDCIQVPVQSIFEHGEKHYCVKETPDSDQGWVAHEVEIGSSNDKFVVITSGLEEGNEIVQGAFLYRDKVDLPELPDDSISSSKKHPGSKTPGNSQKKCGKSEDRRKPKGARSGRHGGSHD